VAFLTGGLGMLILAFAVRAGEPSSNPGDGEPAPNGAAGEARPESLAGPDGKLIQVQAVIPEVPPEVPTGPSAAAVTPAASFTPAVTPTRATAEAPTGATVVSGGEAAVRPSSDVGDLLSKSATGAVDVAHRSPIISEPHIRGYGISQITTLADGAYWLPSRRDLDTITSKLDASNVRDIVVIKGPFAVRYGVGLAFIDLETLGARPWENGYEIHGSTGITYKTNGDQWRGQQAFWGGDKDWGFRLGFDLAAGNDYRTGADVLMPSSYNSQNIDGAFSYYFSKDSHIDIYVMHLDQENVELPGQVFDVSRLISDSYVVRYVLENQPFFDRAVTTGWWNETRLTGDNTNGGKRVQIPQLNLTYLPAPGNGLPLNPDGTVNGLGFVGFTEGDTESTGFRQLVTWGKDKCPQLTLGVDLRFISQKINEFDTATGFTSGWYGIPRSHETDPGIFVDSSLPVSECFTFRLGGRFDYVQANLDDYPTQVATQALAGQVRPTVIQGAFPAGADYLRNYDLGAAFVTAEDKLTHEITAVANVGFAMRAPTITELYAFDPLISVVQNGLNSLRGNPALKSERDLQFDLGLRGNYQHFHGGITGFYARIYDYITYSELGQITPPSNSNGISMAFVNTPRASLAGGELYFDFDASDWVTPFSSLTYVSGRDLTRNQHSQPNVGGFPATQPGVPVPPPQEPLPSIPPLEARIGVRLHEAREQPRYGVEISARVVAAQDQVAASLGEVPTPGFTVWDLRAYWQASKYLLLTAGVENFGDKNYQEHLDLRTGVGALDRFGVFQPGVNFYFGAKLTY
jgi:outer membrane receptor protein involved in Fe transport